MNLLSVEKLSKHYGDKILFEDISFGIEKGQKAALIARNGAGKSTLLKIIFGKETADSGEVVMRNDTRISFLEQEPQLNENISVIDNILQTDSSVFRAVKKYEECLEQQELNPSPEHMKALEAAGVVMDSESAWDYEAKLHQILSRLDIHHLDMQVKTLSGGQKKRIALARLIFDEPEFIIMDEPTNHLDVDLIEWMEDYLSRQNVTLLLVTHDRYFLENVCNEIIELDEGKLFTYQGNYEYFLEKKAEREVTRAKEIETTKNIYRTELEWVRRMPKARSTKSKARTNAFYELKNKVSGVKKERNLELSVKMNHLGGKILEMKKVYKSFDNIPILRGFDYTFKTGERIGIVGKNGSGKTTFLNLILGLEPVDSGKINVGETVQFGYYAQQGLQLKNDKRVIEAVTDIADVIPMKDGSKLHASQFLQMFQFPLNMQHTFVSKLSGGEKRRLFLLTVLMKNPNFLVLDEPTNDLDLITLNTLEDFLLNYRGCLIIVSHDRYFLDKLADHLFVFEGNGSVKDFNGSYAEYRELQYEKEKIEEQKKKSEAKELAVQSAKENSKKKFSYKEKFEFDQLEKEIAELELQKKLLTENLSNGSEDHQQLLKWATELQGVIEKIEAQTLRWMQLAELMS